jgi:hypothetical protein
VPETLGKALKTLDKLLLSVVLGKQGSTYSASAKSSLPSTFSRALGKEKQPLRRRVTGTESLPSVPGDTRQRSFLPSAREKVWFFAECQSHYTRQKRGSLPSVRATTLGKEPIPVPRSWFFAECYAPNTRQSTPLPSVTLGKVISIHLFIYFLYSIQTNKRYHIYITYITYIHHRYHHKHK